MLPGARLPLGCAGRAKSNFFSGEPHPEQAGSPFLTPGHLCWQGRETFWIPSLLDTFRNWMQVREYISEWEFDLRTDGSWLLIQHTTDKVSPLKEASEMSPQRNLAHGSKILVFWIFAVLVFGSAPRKLENFRSSIQVLYVR